MTGESQRLLAGVLSLVLIAGLGTPAFAQTAPLSDTVVVTITGSGTFSYTFAETTAEGSTLSPLGLPVGPDLPPAAFTGLPPHLVVLFEPGSTSIISDILFLNFPGTCNAALCFVSDPDPNGFPISILGGIPASAISAIGENGQCQDVSRELGLPPTITVKIQSDVEGGGGGSCIDGGGGGGGGGAVGGEILPLDMTALFVAGIFTNAFWVLPTLGGIAGAAVALFKIKRKQE